MKNLRWQDQQGPLQYLLRLYRATAGLPYVIVVGAVVGGVHAVSATSFRLCLATRSL